MPEQGKGETTEPNELKKTDFCIKIFSKTFSLISINRYTIDTAKSTIHLNQLSIHKGLESTANIKQFILQQLRNNVGHQHIFETTAIHKKRLEDLFSCNACDCYYYQFSFVRLKIFYQS